MLINIGDAAKEFLENKNSSSIKIISSNCNIGITSSAILIKSLKKLDKKFTSKIITSDSMLNNELEKSKNNLIFLINIESEKIKTDLSKTNTYLIKENTKDSENLKVIFPDKNYGTSITTCLFSEQIYSKEDNLKKIAIISCKNTPDEKELTKNESEYTSKKGLSIYPSTRPLKRALEWSIKPFIPGVTGNPEGTLKLLSEANINPEKNLIDLDSEEMSRLITAVMIKKDDKDSDQTIGEISKINLFGGIEDPKEINALLKTCAKLNKADVAIAYCLENEKAKREAQDIYTKYKQELIAAFRTAEKIEGIAGKGFVILNAKDKIKNTLFRAVLGLLSNSEKYTKGTILIGMAYNEDKIQIQTKMIGKDGRSLKELLEKTIVNLRTGEEKVIEVGGHSLEAGCTLGREKEETFIEEVKKNLEVEVVKV